MKWGLLLHVYQPPNQRPDIFELVCKESYRGLFEALLETHYPVTLNITGTLIEQLETNQKTELLDQIRQLYAQPNISFTQSAYTHALLPLWASSVVHHQLDQNAAIYRHLIDTKWQGTGLYLPECAYGTDLDPIIDEKHIPWVLVDEMSLSTTSYHPTAHLKHSSAVALVRHRQLSLDLASNPLAFSTTLGSSAEPLIAALDGEVFGHFDSRSLTRLRLALKEYGYALAPLSTLATITPSAQTPIRAASWETSTRDLRQRQPYPLWKNRHNAIHQHMWHFYRGVYRAISLSNGLAGNDWVRRHFDNSVASCYFWWANINRTAGPMKTSVWNPDMIVMGITEAIKAVRSDPGVPARRKWQLETEYAEVLKRIWKTHWRLYAAQ